MSFLKSTLCLLCVMCLSAAVVQAADEAPKTSPETAVAPKIKGPPQDVVKYPQDTPEKALESIVKALNGEDFGYFIAWQVTPDSTARTIEKFKTLEAAIEDQKTNPAKIAGRKNMLEVIQKIQKEPKKELEKSGDLELARFLSGEMMIQFEKQKDGGWCLNPKARAKK